MDALAMATQHDLDVVLCDLHMPLMDGFEFVTNLEQVCADSHPPIIAVSALTSSADHARTAAAGFAGHLDKPFTAQALLTLIGGVLSSQ
jgi:CheY-like chemotaxis protein